MPGIDDAWRTRIPQGWVQFGDGSWGPPNPTSPIDQAWPTRTVPGFGSGDPSGVTGYSNNVGFGGGQAGQYAPAPPDLSPPGTTLNSPGGPDIIPPQRSNIGTGKEVGRWSNPFTDAYINPQTGQPEYVGEPASLFAPRGGAAGTGRGAPVGGGFGLGGGSGPTINQGGPAPTIGPGSSAAGGGFSFPNIARLFGGWGAGAVAAAPAVKEGLTNFANSGLVPSSAAQGGDTGGVPIPDSSTAASPFAQPARPVSHSYALPFESGFPDQSSPPGYIGNKSAIPAAVDGRPAGGRPRATPKGGRVDPATVNLGAGSPFTMIDRPNASPTGWNPGAPKTTALDLSRLFGGGGPPPSPLANVPAAAAQPVSAVRRAPRQAPLGVGPYQQGMRPDYTDIYDARARSGYQ